MSVRIEVAPQNLEHQKITTVVHGYIELQEKHIIASYRFLAQQPIDENDIELGWQDTLNDFSQFALKSQITGSELGFLPKSNVWALYLFIKGFSVDIKAHFKKHSEANNAFNQIQEWLLK